MNQENKENMSQSDRFKQAAKDVGADESEAAFEDKLLLNQEHQTVITPNISLPTFVTVISGPPDFNLTTSPF